LKKCFQGAASSLRPCVKKLVKMPSFQKCIRKPAIVKVGKQLKQSAARTNAAFVKCFKQGSQLAQVELIDDDDETNDDGQQEITSSSSSDSSEELSSSIDDADSVTETLGATVEGQKGGKGGLGKCFQNAGKRYKKCFKLALKCPKIKKCFQDPTVSKLRQKSAKFAKQFGLALAKCMRGRGEETEEKGFSCDSVSEF